MASLATIPSLSPPLFSNDQRSRMMRAVSPGNIISPRHSKEYPIPSSSADVLEARRRAFFQKSRPRVISTCAPPVMSDERYQLQPGPSRLQRFKRPPSSLLSSGDDAPDDIAARLYRQRFRQRCNAAMAREKSRSTTIAGIRGGGFQRRFAEGSDDRSDEDDQYDGQPMNSDDLSSSDVEDDTTRGNDDWQYEDEELVRRVMLAEYRNILNAQEYSGKRELGWLGADEVAWLEEELQRETNDDHGQPSSSSMEPPPPVEYLNEEDFLYEQYQHALAQQQQHPDEFDDLDESLFQQIGDEDLAIHRFGDVQMDLS